MTLEGEVHEFLMRHLQAIQENDIQGYKKTTADDLTLYEWWVTPHRIEGVPFHEFMMTENSRRGTVFGAERQQEEKNTPVRFDLANLHIQRYGETAIASYTLLISTSREDGVQVVAHNESRIMVKMDGEWKVVHVHKSPAWNAPHVAD